MSTEKEKKAPQLLRSRLVAWLSLILTLVLLPLGMAASVWVIQGMMHAYVMDILRPGGSSLIYLTSLINYQDQSNLLAAFGLCLLVVYVLIVRKRRFGVVLLGSTVTAFLLFMSVVLIVPSYATSLFDPLNTVLQTLPTDDHLYQLVQRAECHHGCSHSYVILECDQAGWICHNYGTSSERDMEPQSCDQPVPIVSLAQNPVSHRLELTVDGETHTVNRADAILIYGYSWDRCGLSRELRR